MSKNINVAQLPFYAFVPLEIRISKNAETDF